MNDLEEKIMGFFIIEKQPDGSYKRVPLPMTSLFKDSRKVFKNKYSPETAHDDLPVSVIINFRGGKYINISPGEAKIYLSRFEYL